MHNKLCRCSINTRLLLLLLRYVRTGITFHVCGLIFLKLLYTNLRSFFLFLHYFYKLFSNTSPTHRFITRKRTKINFSKIINISSGPHKFHYSNPIIRLKWSRARSLNFKPVMIIDKT